MSFLISFDCEFCTFPKGYGLQNEPTNEFINKGYSQTTKLQYCLQDPWLFVEESSTELMEKLAHVYFL